GLELADPGLMSLKIVALLGVACQSSRPKKPSLATKNNLPLNWVINVVCEGVSELAGPGLMSRTICVLFGGPNEFHSSAPTKPSLAPKKMELPNFVRLKGLEPSGPGRMSLIRTVLCGMPRVRHSSAPCKPSSARKNNCPLNTVTPPARVKLANVNSLGLELAVPGLMSRTKNVSETLPFPSLRHSSRPWTPSSAEKNRSPLNAISSVGFEPVGPRLMSRTICVPARVPSLTHSSWPCSPS